MPAGPKKDLPLAKAEPISGSTAGITYLRTDKKSAQWHPERGVRICKKSSSVDTKGSDEGGRGHASGTGAPPAALGEDHDEAGLPLQSMKVHGGAVDVKRRL